MHHEMSMNHFGWNYTTILNLIFLAIFIVVISLYRSRDKSDDSEFAQDPICGMQVRKSDAPAKAELNGTMYYFCMEGCKEAFLAKN
jgi:YHS domain-containing protein